MIDLEDYDFVDFGCSSGGSIKFAKKHLGGKKELGIDIDPVKVERARAAGFEARQGDLTDRTAFRGKVRFCVLSHFLEHLPNVGVASEVIRTAVSISRRFVFIRQPFFDADGLLAMQGVKLYWSDWSGHKNHMTTLQLVQSLRSIVRSPLVKRVEIYGNRRIRSTESPAVLPIDAAINQHDYEKSSHGPKPIFEISAPCYWESITMIYLAEPPEKEYVQKLFPESELLLARTHYSEPGVVAAVSANGGVSGGTERGPVSEDVLRRPEGRVDKRDLSLLSAIGRSRTSDVPGEG